MWDVGSPFSQMRLLHFPLRNSISATKFSQATFRNSKFAFPQVSLCNRSSCNFDPVISIAHMGFGLRDAILDFPKFYSAILHPQGSFRTVDQLQDGAEPLI